MKLSLIGMSGSGKSYWSKKLQEQKGFKRFCSDDLIEKKLSSELKKFGYSGLHDVAKWLGQPFNLQNEERSRKYLYFEKEAMREILKAIEHSNNYNENIVVDTTGSVIYTEKWILEKLSELTQVIYLDTPVSVQEKMYKLYLEDPKPVIWGNSFTKINGESNFEAMRRCYPKLLAFRSKWYKKIAHIILEYNLLRDPNFSVEEFMEAINHD